MIFQEVFMGPMVVRKGSVRYRRELGEYETCVRGDLGALLANLESAGVSIHSGPESHENGKFAWIIDPEGNKVELWEPKAWDTANKA